MNRKEKIALLNGMLKGETPVSAVFNLWPELTYYALPNDDEHYETETGDVVSFKEVDEKVMTYPKVMIADKEPKERIVNQSVVHKYIDENGEEIVDEEKIARFIKRLSDSVQQSCVSQDEKPLQETLLTLSAAQNPKPPPEPFLSRKDRDVMAQGQLYCVR